MRKMSYYILTLIVFLSFALVASADRKVIVITGDNVRFRSSSSTSSSIIREFNKGAELDLLNQTGPTGNGCNKAWYQAKYGNNTGYICSEFAEIKEIKEEVININDYKDYSEYLKKVGFPDSYLPALIKLHNSHPNWNFKAVNTTIDFNEMLRLEYDGLGRGWSLIEDTGRYIDGYKSTDSWSYNYLTDIFSNNFSGGGTNWYAPNKQTISYYLDTRNFLNDKQVFMFETLSYNKTYHTKEGIEAMLKNTFMTGYANKEQTKTYADAFMESAIEYNVSPYVLISRVIQEVGAKGSTIVSGTVPGFEGYYNFYNIKATGEKDKIITNGLTYAKEKNWSDQYSAIKGGASVIAADYISAGQDTLYLQKWDLILPNPGRHQYMQNIEAPSSESIKTYNGYNGMGLVNSNFVFSIPVFKNMPDKTTLPSTANPNNYLSSLSVNGSYLFEKAVAKTSFDLVLDASTKSIDIAATKLNASARIEGTGSVAIPNDKATIKITVTAGNGDKRVYAINITKKAVEQTKPSTPSNPSSSNTDNNQKVETQQPVVLDISEILRVLNIKNDGTYFYGYAINTDVSKIIKSITEKEKGATVTYTTKDNKVKNSGIVASGDKLKIKTNREEKTYTLIIYGDVNGDGKIAATDYVAIKNHIMDVKKLSDFEKLCADVNRDGKVAATDYVAIKNHIMDVKKITQ